MEEIYIYISCLCFVIVAVNTKSVAPVRAPHHLIRFTESAEYFPVCAIKYWLRPSRPQVDFSHKLVPVSAGPFVLFPLTLISRILLVPSQMAPIVE